MTLASTVVKEKNKFYGEPSRAPRGRDRAVASAPRGDEAEKDLKNQRRRPSGHQGILLANNQSVHATAHEGFLEIFLLLASPAADLGNIGDRGVHWILGYSSQKHSA